MVRWGEGDTGAHEGQVIIDPEMGAFGDNGCIDFIRTQWDDEMDKRSLLPGKHFKLTEVKIFNETSNRIFHL